MTLVADLLAAAAQADARTGDMAPTPSRRLAVVTCMDARIDVYGLFGLELGEAHVFAQRRGAGHRRRPAQPGPVGRDPRRRHRRPGAAHRLQARRGDRVELGARTGADLTFLTIDDHADCPRARRRPAGRPALSRKAPVHLRLALRPRERRSARVEPLGTTWLNPPPRSTASRPSGKAFASQRQGRSVVSPRNRPVTREECDVQFSDIVRPDQCRRRRQPDQRVNPTCCPATLTRRSTMPPHSTTGRPRRRLPVLAALVACLALTPALLALSPGTASAAAYPDNVAQPVNFGDAGFYGPAGGLTLNAPDVGMASTSRRQGLLDRGLRRRHLHLRRRRLLRLGRLHPSEQAHRGHGGHAGWRRLLAGGLRRRHLHLRRRRLLRVPGRATPQLAHRGDGSHGRRQGLLAGRRGRRHLHLWRRRLLRLGRLRPPEQARGRHGAGSRRLRLLVGGIRRRHLHLRGRAVPGLHGRHAPGLPHRRHGRLGQRLPAGRSGRGRLQLRHRLLRLHGRRSAHQPDPGHRGDAEWRRVLAPAVADAACPRRPCSSGPRAPPSRNCSRSSTRWDTGSTRRAAPSTTAPSKRCGRSRRRPASIPTASSGPATWAAVAGGRQTHAAARDAGTRSRSTWPTTSSWW